MSIPQVDVQRERRKYSDEEIVTPGATCQLAVTVLPVLKEDIFEGLVTVMSDVVMARGAAGTAPASGVSSSISSRLATASTLGGT